MRGQKDSHTNGQTDRRAERQCGLTDGPTYKWIERQGNRKIDRQMDVRTDGLI